MGLSTGVHIEPLISTFLP